MEFQELQNKILQVAQNYGQKYQVPINADYALFKLFEETGEFAEAALTQRKLSRPEKYISPEVSKEKVAEELADVVGIAILNAKLLNIDLEAAIQKKWLSRL